MASITKENIGNLHDKLTVKVTKEDYLLSFEKEIKDYSKKANVPGFRKGMVPAGMVKKMYGAPIFYDKVIKSVEKELQEYIDKEKPEIFGQPLPMENDLRGLDMNQPGDYDFPFEIGWKPQVTLDVLKHTQPVFYKVKITPEMVNEEVEKMIVKLGTRLDVEEVSGPENVLDVLFEESDAEGNILPDSASYNNAILVKYFTEEYQQKLQGKRVDNFIVLQLKDAFPEKERGLILSDLQKDKDYPEAAEAYFKMTITKIGFVEKKELNEEFFKEVFPGEDIKTEEDFRKILAEELQKEWNAASRTQLHDQLYHILLETPIELPDEFLKRWIEIGGKKKKDREEVEAEYPKFAHQLKWTLISDKIINDNNLGVSEVALRNRIKTEILRYLGQPATGDENPEWLENYIDQAMKDKKQVQYTAEKMVADHLFTWLESQVTPVEKEISEEEFLEMQHHHSH